MKKTLIPLKRSLIVGACALMVASSFVWSGVWWLSLAGLVLAVELLGRSEVLPFKAFIRYCLLFGYAYFGKVLLWVYGIHTTELIGDTPFAAFFLLLTFLLMVGALAIGFLVFGLLYRKLRVSTSNKTVLLIPALWIIGEYFRSVFFSVFSLGEGGSIGPFWNFGVLAFSGMDMPIKYASRITGLFGLSFLIVLLAVIINRLLHKRYRYAILLVIPLTLSISGWALYQKNDGQRIDIATVSVNDDVEDGYQTGLNNKLGDLGRVDALILPEYSYYFADSQGDKTNNLLPTNVQLAIDSSSKRNDGEIENRVSFHNSQSELIGDFQKSFLIPGGEYIPYIYHMILFYSGNTSLINDFKDNRQVNKANSRERAFYYRGIHYGSLACSGAIAPSFYSHLARQGAEVLTNSASISTLGVSPLYYKQADQMSKFIAVANARPFVQSARGGSSFVLTKDAEKTTTIKSRSDADVTVSSVQTNKRRTVYSVLGEWTLVAGGLTIVMYVYLKTRKSKKIKK